MIQGVGLGQGISLERSLISRRWVLAGGAASVACACSRSWAGAQATIEERLESIRSRVGGRLGVHVLDTQTNRRIGLDDASRFAMASTFKLLLAAAILARVDRGELGLGQKIAFGEKDILSHSPVTSKHVAQGSLTVQQLCAAVIEASDNPAANLLLRLIDGPAGLTRFIRTLGDNETRLDRFELELNSNIKGDPRDTTTPRAMVGSMERVLIGNALFPTSRDLLTQWLVNAMTGLKRIRAGLPKEWKAGDKTGTGGNGAVNDLAIVWPPGRKPVLMAIYMSESTEKVEVLGAAHAEIASAVVGALVAQF